MADRWCAWWGTSHSLALVAGVVTGTIYFGAAFLFYLFGLERIEASKAGVYLSLVPVFALELAFLWSGEMLMPFQISGRVFVLLAVSGAALLSIREDQKTARVKAIH